MRIGVFGGTFDPPHIGHLKVALSAVEKLELDELILMPANRNPIKGRRVAAAPQERLAMVEALVRGADNPKLAYSDLEITRGGPSFTVETMTELQYAKPADYWFVLGADALNSIQQWKQPQRLLKLCRLGVVVRPPATASLLSAKLPDEVKESIDWIEMDPVDISSTELRDRLTRHQNVSQWIPPEVLKSIHTQRLYNA